MSWSLYSVQLQSVGTEAFKLQKGWKSLIKWQKHSLRWWFKSDIIATAVLCQGKLVIFCHETTVIFLHSYELAESTMMREKVWASQNNRKTINRKYIFLFYHSRWIHVTTIFQNNNCGLIHYSNEQHPFNELVKKNQNNMQVTNQCTIQSIHVL